MSAARAEILALLCVQEVKATLGVSDGKVYQMVRSKELRAIRIGRRVMFDPRDLSAWIEAQRGEPNTDGGVIDLGKARGARR